MKGEKTHPISCSLFLCLNFLFIALLIIMCMRKFLCVYFLFFVLFYYTYLGILFCKCLYDIREGVPFWPLAFVSIVFHYFMYVEVLYIYGCIGYQELGGGAWVLVIHPPLTTTACIIEVWHIAPLEMSGRTFTPALISGWGPGKGSLSANWSK